MTGCGDTEGDSKAAWEAEWVRLLFEVRLGPVPMRLECWTQ